MMRSVEKMVGLQLGPNPDEVAAFLVDLVAGR
jgi:hypothetical protein